MNVRKLWDPSLALILITGVLTIALTLIAAGDGTLPGDVSILNAMHEIETPVANNLDLTGYWIGSMPGIAGVAIVLTVACFVTGRLAEAVLIMISAGLRVLNPVLKWLIESPRPTPDVVQVTEDATNYGFPSGHVMGVVLLYGGLSYIAHLTVRKRPVRLSIQWFCALVIIVTSFSRLYSGAHWPSDVLGAYLWSAFLIMILIRTYNRTLLYYLERARTSGSRMPDVRRTEHS